MTPPGSALCVVMPGYLPFTCGMCWDLRDFRSLRLVCFRLTCAYHPKEGSLHLHLAPGRGSGKTYSMIPAVCHTVCVLFNRYPAVTRSWPSVLGNMR